MLVQFYTSTLTPPQKKNIFFKIPYKFLYLVSLPEGAPELGEDEREEARPQGGGDLDQCVPGSVPDLHRSRLQEVTHLQQDPIKKFLKKLKSLYL